MIDTFDDLRDQLNAYGEAKGLSLAIYEANTSVRFELLDIYIEDNVFCIDIGKIGA